MNVAFFKARIIHLANNLILDLCNVRKCTFFLLSAYGGFFALQVFLSSRVIYVLVFDLKWNLAHQTSSSAKLASGGEAIGESPSGQTADDEPMSRLDYLDFWMNSVHANAARNAGAAYAGGSDAALSPPIFIVGTNRNSLHGDAEQQHHLAQGQFDKIKKLVHRKPYEKHVISRYYAVETLPDDLSVDEQVKELSYRVTRKIIN